MQVTIRAKQVELTEELREHVRVRLGFGLSRFGHRIRTVVVNLADINGPRGGLDQQCQVVVKLRPSGEVSVQHVDRDLFSAVSLAADRVSRAVSRTLDRRREARINWQGVNPREQSWLSESSQESVS